MDLAAAEREVRAMGARVELLTAERNAFRDVVEVGVVLDGLAATEEGAIFADKYESAVASLEVAQTASAEAMAAIDATEAGAEAMAAELRRQIHELETGRAADRQAWSQRNDRLVELHQHDMDALAAEMDGLAAMLDGVKAERDLLKDKVADLEASAAVVSDGEAATRAEIAGMRDLLAAASERLAAAETDNDRLHARTATAQVCLLPCCANSICI